MAKPDLGGKRQCQNCGTKFFDLNKDPILCPKCGTVFQVAALSSRAATRAAPAASDDEEAETEGAEVVPLDEADNVEDGKVAAVVPDEDSVDEDDDSADADDTFLEEEEEDDADVSDLIDGDIEDDEER